MESGHEKTIKVFKISSNKKSRSGNTRRPSHGQAQQHKILITRKKENRTTSPVAWEKQKYKHTPVKISGETEGGQYHEREEIRKIPMLKNKINVTRKRQTNDNTREHLEVSPFNKKRLLLPQKDRKRKNRYVKKGRPEKQTDLRWYKRREGHHKTGNDLQNASAGGWHERE